MKLKEVREYLSLIRTTSDGYLTKESINIIIDLIEDYTEKVDNRIEYHRRDKDKHDN